MCNQDNNNYTPDSITDSMHSLIDTYNDRIYSDVLCCGYSYCGWCKNVVMWLLKYCMLDCDRFHALLFRFVSCFWLRQWVDMVLCEVVRFSPGKPGAMCVDNRLHNLDLSAVVIAHAV